MSDDVKKAVDARYRNSFGRAAGCLPRNRAQDDGPPIFVNAEIAIAR